MTAQQVNHFSTRRSWRSMLLSDTEVLLLLTLALILLHALANNQYSFHRNELDTLDNAQQLAWGYVAYPPLTPFFGWLALTVFGPSLAGVRLFAAVAMGIVLVLTGLMARDLGGRRPAQIIAALAAEISPVVMTGGVMLHYLIFDYLWWVFAAFCMIRLLRTWDHALASASGARRHISCHMNTLRLIAAANVWVQIRAYRRSNVRLRIARFCRVVGIS